MTEQASSSIVVDRAPAEVMAVIADVAAYPEWAGFITSVEVLSTGDGGLPREVRFDLDAGVVKDSYVVAYDWHGDTSVSWHLVSAEVLQAMDGSYELTPAGSATDVTYRLEVDLTIPMLGMFKRKAEKVIMDMALKELKRRCESLT